MNMQTGQQRFNIYLGLLLVAVLAAGCQTASKRDNELSTLRLHLEVNADGTDRNEAVPVYRASPVMIIVERNPFLYESTVSGARLVDMAGAFAIQVQFNQQGTRLLEQYSTAYKGKRVAVFSQFVTTTNQARWLAAPLIARNITDGSFVFTPDATREEAERIVAGLNAVAKKFDNQKP